MFIIILLGLYLYLYSLLIQGLFLIVTF